MLRYFFVLTKVSPPLREYSQLETMLALRKLGWSYTALGDHFGVEKTTIRYLCRKFGLSEREVETTHQREPVRTKPDPYYDEDEGPINPGKTYAEYLADERARSRKLQSL